MEIQLSKNTIKSFFCKHSKDKFIRNIYGDEIIWGTPDFHRSIWSCKKYKYLFYVKGLHKVA